MHRRDVLKGAAGLAAYASVASGVSCAPSAAVSDGSLSEDIEAESTMGTLGSIYKRSAIYVPAPCAETTLLVGPNDKLTSFSFPYHQQQARVIVRDYASGAQIASANWPAANTGGGTAIVANGVVHVFAASPFVGAANQVLHGVLDQNWSMSTPAVVHTATAPMNICNLGITASPLGYIMSLETQQTQQVYFLRSADLNSWSPIGTPMATGVYLGSPKIYWSQRRGCFFLTFLRYVGGKFETAVAKFTADLNSYVIAPHPLIAPDGAGETINASDMTMAEQDGITHLIYLDGDQTSYANYRAAIYPGSMEDLWEEFFPFEQAPNPPPPATGNILPQMTGGTTASVTISASDTHTAGFHAWHAADRNSSTFYHCGAAAYPHWWKSDFPQPVTPTSYGIKCRPGFAGQAPKDFTLAALVNGTWTAIDTRSGVTGYQDGVFKDFTVAAPVGASSFRLLVTANVEGSANLSFAEIELRT